jgi:hypothetical protein
MLSSPKKTAHTDSWAHITDVPSRKGGSGGGVKLTPYIHLVPRLRMSGDIPLFHPYALVAWAGTSTMIMMIMDEIQILFSRSFYLAT